MNLSPPFRRPILDLSGLLHPEKANVRTLWIWGAAAELARERRIGKNESLRLAAEKWREREASK